MTLVYANTVIESYQTVQHRVDIYLLDTVNYSSQVDAFETYLSGEELSRAQRYLGADLQQRFILQHGITRHLLGYYLQKLPKEVEIETPKYGKPQVKGLHFNISHSDQYLAVAISRDVPVGVDIESMDRNIDLNHVAALALSDAERFNLFALPINLQKLTLLRTWVAKEAYWKYIGEGLNSLLKQYELVPTLENDVFSIGGNKATKRIHRIKTFSCPSMRLLGAVSYQGVGAEVFVRVGQLPTVR